MHSNDQYKINLCNYLETLITLWDYELGKRGRGSVLNCIGFVFASSWDLLTPLGIPRRNTLLLLMIFQLLCTRLDRESPHIWSPNCYPGKFQSVPPPVHHQTGQFSKLL